jgi:cytochrome b pre-mRNA-processing protein 3
MVAMDMSLIRGDTEMASAIWRNILGARGAKGIAFPGDPAKFRRSINYAGSDINKLEKMNVEEEELKDDGSGVHDFPPDEADKYLAYPELMLDLVQYVRRELARLDKLTDEQIVYGDWEELMFRPIREAAPPSSVSPPPQKSTVSTKKASKRQTTT